jgi:hypothetical protein
MTNFKRVGLWLRFRPECPKYKARAITTWLRYLVLPIVSTMIPSHNAAQIMQSALYSANSWKYQIIVNLKFQAMRLLTNDPDRARGHSFT